jgi:TetR/AcrR family transcriptional repressor of lmrAB and yxaGH operons
VSAQAEKEGTRDRLLDAATRLLRRSGLSGAGINEIVRESGAPKGSVYHHFPGGKEQIATEALARHARTVVAFIDAAVAGKRSPPAKLEALFEAFALRVEQGEFLHTCPAGTVCLDLEAGMDGLRLAVADSFEAYLGAIARHFPLATLQRTRSFAGLVLTAIEGAYLRCRAERSGAPFREAGKWLATLLQNSMRPGTRAVVRTT